MLEITTIESALTDYWGQFVFFILRGSFDQCKSIFMKPWMQSGYHESSVLVIDKVHLELCMYQVLVETYHLATMYTVCIIGSAWKFYLG